ncbi:MAG: hypothetical protein ACYTA5_20700 [Planctomycetota bacterium]
MSSNAESVLPALYAGWMDELLGGPIPMEIEATCDDCAMCAGSSIPPGDLNIVFNSKTKCCTYIPELPNFLVGGMINNESSDFAAGKATLEARLHQGVVVTPLGIGNSPTERLVYKHTTQNMAFGRNPDLRCPHYLAQQGGQCGIWQHRAAVCATWFCKYVRGAVGLRFWKMVQQLLAQVESDLMHWCLGELDIGTEALRRIVPDSDSDATPIDPVCEGQLDGRMSDEVHETAWGNWAGREQEFFQACNRLVEPLAWEDVTRIGGPKIGICEHLVRQAYTNLLADELPASLKVGSFKILHMGKEFHRIQTYSPLDPIDIPRTLMNVLHYFDGRPTDDALRTIALETGLQLDETLIRKLVDFEVLVS